MQFCLRSRIYNNSHCIYCRTPPASCKWLKTYFTTIGCDVMLCSVSLITESIALAAPLVIPSTTALSHLKFVSFAELLAV